MLPLIHLTDLYHPPQDPDDYFDLATIYALPELELRAVVLDLTRQFVAGTPGNAGGWPTREDMPREPALLPIAQLGYLTGRPVPAAIGPLDPLRGPDDPATDRPLQEQAGIVLLLNTLRASPTPVWVSVVASVRVLTAAYNREPALLREKVAGVLLNAGSSGDFLEWNVALDPAAYAGLWRSGLPIYWYPCATATGPFELGEHNTFWRATQGDLLRDLPRPLRAWFHHGVAGLARADLTQALRELGTGSAYEQLLHAPRNLWSTASLVHVAGRTLGATPDGWRFVPRAAAAPDPAPAWTHQPVRVTVADSGHTRWEPATPAAANAQLFTRPASAAHAPAMTTALNVLLRALPC